MGERPILAAEQEALVAVSAALGTRSQPEIAAALRRAIGVAPPRAVEEVLLQSHLFVGFPDALNALALWRELSGALSPPPVEESPELWKVRGEEVCAAVYGGNYAKLRANVTELHPDLDLWMVEGGYGRVIGRAGLPLVTRELCIAALLAVWGVPRQLHSHLRGALNAGASPAEVDGAVEIACKLLAAAAAAEVRRLWAEVRRKRGTSDEGRAKVPGNALPEVVTGS